MSKPIDKEPVEEGKLIQEHLENINMDPWYFIYQVYVNPNRKVEKKTRD
ncbi:MAG: hypothetical protein OEM79_04985 [Nitrosopumilus sp.]|nr:hypothetical protein [Nitrosopumilus sp.]